MHDGFMTSQELDPEALKHHRSLNKVNTDNLTNHVRSLGCDSEASATHWHFHHRLHGWRRRRIANQRLVKTTHNTVTAS